MKIHPHMLAARGDRKVKNSRHQFPNFARPTKQEEAEFYSRNANGPVTVARGAAP